MKRAGFLLILLSLLLSGCITATNRKDAKVHYTLGLSYLREPNHSLALREFLLAAEANPGDPEVQLALGQTYQLLKSYPEAERSYRKALSLGESTYTPIVQNNLGALYLDMERWDDAIRLFNQAAANLLFQNPEVSHAGIGYAKFKKGDVLSAINAYRRSIEINPRYAPARLRLAEAYEAFGKPDLAFGEYQEAVKLAPENVALQYQYGLIAAKTGKKVQAINAFREVIRLAPAGEEAKLAADNIKLLQ